MIKYNVIPSDEFVCEVENHLRFLAKVSVPASRKLGSLFVKALSNLSTSAEAYALFYNQYRKIVVANRYAIFYSVIGKNVYVDRIFDMRAGEYNDIILDNE